MVGDERRHAGEPEPTAPLTIELDRDSGQIRIRRTTPLGTYTESVER